MKKIIFFLTYLIYTSSMCASSLAELEKQYSDLSKKITLCKNQTELVLLKQQRNQILEGMSYHENNIPAASSLSLENEFDRFKVWFEHSFILENHQYHVMQQVEKLFHDVLEHHEQKTELACAQHTALLNFFLNLKSARLKLELLGIGSFYAGKNKALVTVPITSVQRVNIMSRVVKKLCQKLASCWHDQHRLEKQCSQHALHACVVRAITFTMPRSCKTSWVKRWYHAAHKKLTTIFMNRSIKLFDSQVTIYDALSYDLVMHHVILCDNVVNSFDEYALCQHDNKTSRQQCKKQVQQVKKLLARKREKLACKQDQRWDGRVAGVFIALLETRLEHINHVLAAYDKPGFYKLAQEDLFDMHDRLKMLFNEHSVLRKKAVAEFFMRYNKILDRYKQDVLENKQPSQDLLREILSLVVTLREQRPGFLKSLVWGNQTKLYFLDGMIETLEKIDPRVKESNVVDQFVYRVLHADQSGLSNKIVKNVLGSEVITDMVLKQFKRVVEFLQKNQQGKVSK